MPDQPSHIVLGLDFGTTNTAVATANGASGVQVLPIDEHSSNSSILRSLIYTNPQKVFLFGQEAVDAYLIDVAQGERRTRKLIYTGKKFKSAKWSFIGGYAGEEWLPVILEIEEGTGGRLIQSLKTALSSTFIKAIDLFGEQVKIEELLSIFLGEVKQRSENVLGTEVKSAVIGRPVHFVGHDDILSLARLEKAADLAGFENVVFEYEPVGAAWNYGLGTDQKKQTVFVFDFGGGTLDFTVIKFPQKVILATHGLPIGGDLLNAKIFESKIAKYFGINARFGPSQVNIPKSIFEHLKTWYQISLLKKETFLNQFEEFRFRSSDIAAINALESLIVNNLGFSLYEEIDRAKLELSEKEYSTINFHAKDINISQSLTKSEFEQIISDETNQIAQGIAKTLEISRLDASDIDYVVTTGGSSLIPAIRQLLVAIFCENKLIAQDPFTSVASGLAIRAKEIFG
jgi:hypothetical chaperone protein